MSLSSNKLDLRFVDALIDGLQIVHDFNYINSGTGIITVNPTQLTNLQEKINTLKEIREEIKSNYKSINLNKIIAEINS